MYALKLFETRPIRGRVFHSSFWFEFNQWYVGFSWHFLPGSHRFLVLHLLCIELTLGTYTTTRRR